MVAITSLCVMISFCYTDVKTGMHQLY
uniref:NADH dehydrogenase subunit 5 n=1 Tax=Heterorhabditis bacteriophora TaxID=37862 RepID=A0A1I7WDU9_HETBA